ncbi:DUF1670 domain-containing protein [Geochorda subterranea]
MLDVGRTLTHKNRIVRLLLQGISVLEIARHRSAPASNRVVPVLDSHD